MSPKVAGDHTPADQIGSKTFLESVMIASVMVEADQQPISFSTALLRRPSMRANSSVLRTEHKACDPTLVDETDLPLGPAVGELDRIDVVSGLAHAAK